MAKRRSKTKKKQPAPKARSPLFWAFAAVLAVAVSLFLYLPRDETPVPPKPERTPPGPTTAHYERGLTLAGVPVDRSYPYTVTILQNTGYVTGYCETRKGPVWVGYRLFAVDTPETHKRLSRFRVDERTRTR
ncbi:hypothetical protein GF324_09780, partial [bacterium]|nr:hypothetical protein [bacterium]